MLLAWDEVEDGSKEIREGPVQKGDLRRVSIVGGSSLIKYLVKNQSLSSHKEGPVVTKKFKFKRTQRCQNVCRPKCEKVFIAKKNEQ